MSGKIVAKGASSVHMELVENKGKSFQTNQGAVHATGQHTITLQ